MEVCFRRIRISRISRIRQFKNMILCLYQDKFYVRVKENISATVFAVHISNLPHSFEVSLL